MSSTPPAENGFDLWFRENYSPGAAKALKVTATLHHEKSPFQEVHILETVDFGRMMSLDGCVMVTDKDEFVYHEMPTHVAFLTHPNPRRALVVGGGDGGTVREILRHPSVQEVDLVEIDEAVVRLSRQFFPKLTTGLDDPRVSVHYKDGIAWVKKTKKPYDIILIDSTDFFGMAEGLASVKFFKDIHRALAPDGILAMQSEDAWYFHKPMAMVYHNLEKVFPGQVFGYGAFIPTYVSGFWTFALASKKHHPLKNLDKKRARAIAAESFYYNPHLHQGAFALPNFVQKPMGPAALRAFS